MTEKVETLSDDERVALFRRYRSTRDRDLRNRLVEEHAGLADALARRMANRGESHDDLRQVALVGLLKAVERFDPDHGVRFTSFATPTILGELKRHFRDRGWAVRVPRRIQELNLEVRSATETLTQELGRAPTTDEIAARTGLATEEVIESTEAGGLYRLSSLDSTVGSDDDWEPSSWLAVDDSALAGAADRVTVEQLLELLPDREQRIMHLRFYEGLTQSEIATQVGVSQMHVSRLLTRSIAALGELARAPVATRDA